MAFYPTTETDIVITKSVLTHSVCSVFSACGMSLRDATLLAGSLVHADMRGVHSHGVLRVPDYVAKLTTEGVDPRGRPRLTVDKAGALVVDGGNSMGQIGLDFTMAKAIERAQSTAIAFAAVGGSNHCGALDYFAIKALSAGMIGICGTNALPTMAPWGGRDKIVGINPVAIALPGGTSGGFVLDCAFGETAHGKIRVYAQKGTPIPENWAFDEEGRPTTDAVAAMNGLIRPIGGHKGVGFGMAIGMLSSFLSGAAYGTELGNMIDGPVAGRDGHFAIAIDISAFVPLETFRARVDAAIAEARTSSPAVPGTRLFTPGEIEREIEHDYDRSGVRLSRETVQGIVEAGAARRASGDGFLQLQKSFVSALASR